MPGFLQNERRGAIAAWVPFVLLVCVLAPCICVGFPGQDRASEGHHGQGAAHWERRADSVRDAIQHAWRGYRRYASSSDDLKPLAKVGHQWMYARATFYDSLDLLYLAGLHKDFEEAVAEITSPLSPWTYWHRGTPTSVVFPVKTFEYHIRVVGGLLGAYALSGRRELLRAAAHAADCVLDSFATPNGIPRPFFRVAHPTRSPLLALVAKLLDSCRVASDRAVWRNYLASFGSFGLELRVLSRETGDPRYVGAADALQAIVHRRWVRLGRPELLPRTWGVPPPAWAVRFFGAPDDVSDTDRYPPRWVGFGSAGDSFYEYLVKEQLVDGGGGTAMHREMYDVVARQCHSVNSSACRHDVGRNGNATLITAVAAGELLRGRDRQPHLACFAGGMFALGAKMLPGHAADMALATGITSQCVASYTMTPTGLGADYTKVGPDGELSWPEGRYHLRPEVVESLFVLYRTTRDDKLVPHPDGLKKASAPLARGHISLILSVLFPAAGVRYREAAWTIFQAIERNCRVANGYVGFRNVHDGKDLDDYMPSFFIAETLKYLFLLFSDPSLLPLDEWVFNTEAHAYPLKNRCEEKEDADGTLLGNYPTLPACSGSLQGPPLQEVPWDVVAFLLCLYAVLRCCRWCRGSPHCARARATPRERCNRHWWPGASNMRRLPWLKARKDPLLMV